ncbi:MAG: hypothetical protein ACQEV7_19110 [Bacillota bacterium]
MIMQRFGPITSTFGSITATFGQINAGFGPIPRKPRLRNEKKTPDYVLLTSSKQTIT